ncbi:MAG: NTP transferase domain-containing protein [DPANN group archaeon]|nr:NTP transferase domain-containing protein [DPANN group archaeon]
MKVVILCGGKGTRLREETEFIPKPLVEIGNKPILWHIMKIYASQGYKDFVLALGYKGELIKHYFKNYQWMSHDFSMNLKHPDELTIHKKDMLDWNITFVDTGKKTLTAGRLKRVAPHIDGDRFMLTYGDGLADINIKKLLAFHEQKKKLATITGLHPISKYGVLKVDGGLVSEFKEKPILDDVINGGFMVFEKAIFDRIDVKQDAMLVDKTLPDLAKEENLAIYHHEGYWHSMDTYKDYEDLNEAYSEEHIPWRTW